MFTEVMLTGRGLRFARGAATATFFSQGFLLACWASRIPQIKAATGLSNSLFGLALLASPLASIAAMRPARILLARYGSRALIRVLAIGAGGAVTLLAVSRNGGGLALALAISGAVGGVLSVAMNAQAVQIERLYHRPLMIGFHAGYSFGGLAGALIGSLAARSDYSPPRHVAVAAVCSAALVLAVSRWLLPAAAEPPADPSRPPTRRHPVPGRRLLWVLGMIVFCMLMSEGAMADWSALYLRDALGATAGTAALGYGAFSLAMAVSRIAGNRILAHVGPVAMVRVAAAVAAVSLAVALLVATPGIAVAGFAVFGLGMSVVAPVAYSAAGNIPGIPAGTALAPVMGVGYAGLFAGPAIIGMVAQVAGLPVALGIPAALAACIVLLAPAVRHARGGKEPDATAAAPGTARAAG